LTPEVSGQAAFDEARPRRDAALTSRRERL
jgi:hypothetical protein